jgi:hypothetical protein
VGAGGQEGERMGKKMKSLWSISRSHITEEHWEFDILSGFYVPKQ